MLSVAALLLTGYEPGRWRRAISLFAPGIVVFLSVFIIERTADSMVV
jgi:hypothetical protein